MLRVHSATLFPTEEPLAREQMIGREADVQELVTQLAGGVHRIVAAPRRTGKSSVCRAAVAELRDRGFYTVSVSLFGLTDGPALARGLVAETLANRDGLHKLIQHTRSAAGFVLRGASLALMLKVKSELGDAVEMAFDPTAISRRPTAEAITAALRLPQTIAERDDRQLVVFIDELQELAGRRAPYGDPDALLGQVREILHASPRVTCLFAGSIEHLMRDIFTSARRPMAGFGGFHELQPIDEQQWRIGLAERFQHDKCAINDDALARIVNTGEEHPRSTMLIAQQTHVAAVEEDTRAIDLLVAERGFRSAMLAEQTRHVDLVDRIRALGAVALRVTRRLAAHDAPYRAAADAKAVTRALNALALAGITSRRGRGDWYISDPLLARYIREHLGGTA
jgi:hypothetical protein